MPSELLWGKTLIALSNTDINSDPEAVFEKIKITDKQKEILLDSISKKMAPQPVKVRADCELTCFKNEGIDAIRAALLEAKKAVCEENFKVDVSLITILIPIINSSKLLHHHITNVKLWL